MYPTLWLGPWRIYTYDLLFWTAIVLGIAAAFVRVRRIEGFSQVTVHDLIDALFWVILGSLAGSYLVAVLPKAIVALRGDPLPTAWWSGGQQWLGAVGGGSLAWYVYGRRRLGMVGLTLDRAAPVLPLILATVRVGCLMAGCCYGRQTTSWLGLLLPDDRGVWALRYPTQLFSIAANVLLFVALLAVERYAIKRSGSPLRGWPFDGFLFLLYIELHSAVRFSLEFLQADTPSLWGPLTWAHAYCLVAAGLAAWLLASHLKRAAGRVGDALPRHAQPEIAALRPPTAE